MSKILLKPAFFLLLVSFLFSNCATIVSKSSYPVSVNTDPDGVQVTITDKRGKVVFKGKSPTAVKLKAGAGFFSRAEYQVKLSSNGYDEKVLPVTFKLNGWYFGNILFGGLLGLLIVDPASGAMWRIDKSTADVSETMTRSSVSVNEPSLKIIDIKDVPKDVKASLVRVN